MIVFFGTRSSKTKTTASNQSCSNCNTEQALNIITRQRYFHIFWIPFFPTSGKSTYLHCPACDAAWQIDNQEAKKLSHHAKTPIWMFLGLIIIALFIGSAVIGGKVDQSNTMKWLNQPEVGDIYNYQTPDSSFSILKIVRVEGDTVLFQQHQNIVTKSSQIYRLHSLEGNEEDLYYTNEEDLSRIAIKDLLPLKEQKIILQVSRQ